MLSPVAAAQALGAPDGCVEVHVPSEVALDVLGALAGAATAAQVAAAAASRLAGVPGVRAAAVLQRASQHAVVLGSSGYGCHSMAAGARLPLTAGLPATEAIRTGRLVQAGEGPGWCAVPWGGPRAQRGTLLLSLDGPALLAAADRASLERLCAAVGAALARADSAAADRADLAEVLSLLTPAPLAEPPGWAQALVQLPYGGAVGGDVAMSLPAADGGWWLLVGDVCGSGRAAATVAAAVRVAVRGCVPGAKGPAELLTRLDAVLRPEMPMDGFVTAVAVHLRDGRLRVASAGHPAPLLISAAGDLTELPVSPGVPLALATAASLAPPAELALDLSVGTLLALYTDGLTDRRHPDGDLAVRELARCALVDLDPDQAARRLVAAADAAGPAGDDTTVLVARLAG